MFVEKHQGEDVGLYSLDSIASDMVRITKGGDVPSWGGISSLGICANHPIRENPGTTQAVTTAPCNGTQVEGQIEELQLVRDCRQEAEAVIDVGKMLGLSFRDQESEVVQKVMDLEAKECAGPVEGTLGSQQEGRDGSS